MRWDIEVGLSFVDPKRPFYSNNFGEVRIQAAMKWLRPIDQSHLVQLLGRELMRQTDTDD